MLVLYLLRNTYTPGRQYLYAAHLDRWMSVDPFYRLRQMLNLHNDAIRDIVYYRDKAPSLHCSAKSPRFHLVALPALYYCKSPLMANNALSHLHLDQNRKSSMKTAFKSYRLHSPTTRDTTRSLEHHFSANCSQTLAVRPIQPQILGTTLGPWGSSQEHLL